MEFLLMVIDCLPFACLVLRRLGTLIPAVMSGGLEAGALAGQKRGVHMWGHEVEIMLNNAFVFQLMACLSCISQ